MPISRAVVLHGYFASPAAHWFPWLQSELAPAVTVEVPALPEPTAPEPGAWVAAAAAAIGTPSPELAIVGHSLGVITGLRALDQAQGDWSLGALVLVAGFADPLPALPPLNPFLEAPIDLANLRDRVGSIVVVGSDNDPIVPREATEALASRLGVELTVVPGAGHFLDSEGYTELPVVADALRSA